MFLKIKKMFLKGLFKFNFLKKKTIVVAPLTMFYYYYFFLVSVCVGTWDCVHARVTKSMAWHCTLCALRLGLNFITPQSKGLLVS